MKSRKDKKKIGQTIKKTWKQLDEYYQSVICKPFKKTWEQLNEYCGIMLSKEFRKIFFAILIMFIMFGIGLMAQNAAYSILIMMAAAIFYLMIKQNTQEQQERVEERNKEVTEMAAMILELAKRAKAAGDKEIKIDEWTEHDKEHFLISMGTEKHGMFDDGKKVHPDLINDDGEFDIFGGYNRKHGKK